MSSGTDKNMSLNVNAAPFMPSVSGQVEKPNAWQVQADMLGNHQHMSSSEYTQEAYASYSKETRYSGKYTPPNSMVAIPPHPDSAQHTPIQHPRSNGSTPNIKPRTGSTYQSRCPKGHKLFLTSGAQLVTDGDNDNIVECGGVFCRRCEKEDLDKAGEGYFTCSTCNWDCCQACESAPYASTIPPMPPLPQSLHYDYYYPMEDVLTDIKKHLSKLKKEEPFGLSRMPLEKLHAYEEKLRKEVNDLFPQYIDVAPKVNVIQTEAKEPKKKKKKPEKKPPAFKVGDRVIYVGGDRFKGDKVWKDGANVRVGQEGEIQEYEPRSQFPYKVMFPHVYVKLSEKDLEIAPKKKADEKKNNKKKKTVETVQRKKQETTPTVPTESVAESEVCELQQLEVPTQSTTSSVLDNLGIKIALLGLLAGATVFLFRRSTKK